MGIELVISNEIWHHKEGYFEFEDWQNVEAKLERSGNPDAIVSGPKSRLGGIEVLCSLRGNEEQFRNYLTSKNKVIKPHQIHSNRVLIVPAYHSEFPTCHFNPSICHCEERSDEAISSVPCHSDPSLIPRLGGAHSVQGGLREESKILEGDGLLTNEKNIYLMISIADCLPIYIYDVVKKIIGLLHAGKKGTQQFILKNAIKLMIKEFGSVSENISLLFGPSICPKCYDYDLWENNIKQANEMGISNIINPQICTAENLDLFYSYRKEKGIKGRMFAVIRIKDV